MLYLIQFFNKFLTPKNILALGEHLYPWKDNMGQGILSQVQFFDQTIMSQMQFFNKQLSTSFGGNSYKALERTIWVKPHFRANSFLINIWEHQEIYEFSWKSVLDLWKRHLCQTVLPLGQNLLVKLEKYNNKSFMFFITID